MHGTFPDRASKLSLPQLRLPTVYAVTSDLNSPPAGLQVCALCLFNAFLFSLGYF